MGLAMALDIDTVYRDNIVKGDIHSGAHDPDKAEIRALLKALFGFAGNPAVVKLTAAALAAVTPADENYGGVVLNDPDPTKSGLWYRSGGAWVWGRGFPDTFAYISLAGAANAQTGAVSAGVNPGTVLVYFATVSTENTGPMTLSISGGTARDVVNAAGNALSAGEWTGTVLFFLNSDGDYQLLFDAGAVAAAAASATAADAARILAEAAAAAAGEGVAPAANRSVLAGIDSGIKSTATLKEAGREGLFTWDGSDLSASVTIDTAQGDFVSPTGDATGTSGAWKRIRKVGDLFKTSEYGDDIAVAMAVCSHLGGGTVEINKRGTIALPSGLLVPGNVQLVGLGAGITTLSGDNLAVIGDFVSLAGVAGGDGWAVLANSAASRAELPSFSPIGVKEGEITFGSAHGLVEGDEIDIADTANSSFSAYRAEYRRGERNRVVGVDGNKVYLLTGALFDYTYSTTVKAWKVNPRRGRFGGFTLDMADCPSSGTWGGVKVFRGDSLEVDDMEVIRAAYTGIEFDQCFSMTPKRLKASTRVDSAYAGTSEYACTITNSTDVAASGEFVANWAATDLGGWDVAGAVQNYKCGFEHSTLTAEYTHPAAGMHGNSQDGFYRHCHINGGVAQAGLGSVVSDCVVSLRRGDQRFSVYLTEVLGGLHAVRDTQIDSTKDAGNAAEVPDLPAGGAIFWNVESSASSPVRLELKNVRLEATNETMPIYAECASASSSMSIDIDGLDLEIGGAAEVIRVIKTAGSDGDYFHMANVKNLATGVDYARFDGSYVADDMVFPEQSGLWSEVSATLPNQASSLIDLAHGYPTGYPARGLACLQDYNLGNKVFASLRSISNTQVRIHVATGDDTNMGSGTINAAWEVW